MSNTNMPDEIWMQLVYDENHVPSLDTWSKDNIHIDDIKYIRADLVPTQSVDECETCKGDPETCASVPNIRHCEKAQRNREVEDKDRVLHDQVSKFQPLGKPLGTLLNWGGGDTISSGITIQTKDGDICVNSVNDVHYLERIIKEHAEYENRIEGLSELENPWTVGMTDIFGSQSHRYYAFEKARQDAIKHMKGE